MASRRDKQTPLEDQLDFDWGASGAEDVKKSGAPIGQDVDLAWGASGVPDAPSSIQAAGKLEKQSGAVEEVAAKRAAADGVPVPESEQVEQDIRAREREDWFLRLPKNEQARLREYWRAEVRKFDDWDAWYAKLRRHTILEGVVILGGVQILVPGGSFLVGSILGALLGWVWFRKEAGRFLRVVTIVPLYFAMQFVMSVGMTGSLHDPSGPMFMFYAALAMACFAALSGIIYERKIVDGPHG